MEIQFIDLDELVGKVRNRQVRNYFNEAVTAYRAGAYKAAVISTWISICVDVIEKIKELAIGNDANAKAIENRLLAIKPNDYPGMQAFEKDILKFACDELEIISHIEKSQLERIKDDRNICAHPTFSIDGQQFNPTPELTRAYLVHAAYYLLTKTPVKGKVVVQNIFVLIDNESFPSDKEKAFTVLSSDKYLGRVKESSIRNLVIIILKRIFKDEASFNYLTFPKFIYAISAISRINPNVYRDTISEKLPVMLAEANVRLFKRIIPLLSKESSVFFAIDEASFLRIEECIMQMDTDNLLKYDVPSLASKNHKIFDIFNKLISDKNFGDIYKLLSNSPCKALKDLSCEYFINSRSFASAYNNGINVLLPVSEFLNDGDLENVLNGAKKNSQWGINQILNADGIDEVFANLYLKTKNNILNHSKIWKDFYTDICERGFKLKSLHECLISEKLLEEEIDENKIEDEQNEV